MVLVGTLSMFNATEACADDDETPGTHDKLTAPEYFERAKDHFKRGRYKDAAEDFLKAYEISPHPTVLANIGLSYDKAEQVPQAVKMYRQYMSEVGNLNEDQEIATRLAELEQKIADLQISCAVDPCTVKVDGVDHGQAPLSIILYPGLHRIEAMSEDQSTDIVQILLRAGKHERVVLDFESSDETEAAADTSQQESTVPDGAPADVSPRFGAPFWIFASTSVAAGVVTVVFGSLTLRDKSEFDDAHQLDADVKEQGEKNRRVTNVMLGVTVGSLLASAGFAIYDLWPKREKQAQTLAILPGPGLGLRARMRF